MPKEMKGKNYTVIHVLLFVVVFKIYDLDNDGLISNGELFLSLRMMIGDNLPLPQLQVIFFVTRSKSLIKP